MKHRKLRVVCITALIQALSVGCFTGDAGDVVRHPILDSLSVDPTTAQVVGGEEELSPELQEFADRLRTRSTLFTAGALEGSDSAHAFGRIVDALITGDSLVLLLDQQSSVVHGFRMNGSHALSFGGSGEGPGEFDFPVALVGPSDSEIMVVDGALTGHRFIREANGYEFQNRIELPGFAQDACIAGGRVVIHTPAFVPGEGGGGVLAAFQSSGEQEREFAMPYRHGDRVVSSRLNAGSIACTDSTVLLGFAAQNRMDAYRLSDGALVWHTEFDGLNVPATLESTLDDGRTAVRMEAPTEGAFHRLVSAAGGVDTPVLVQFEARTAEDLANRVDRFDLESYVVDPNTGRGGFLNTGIGRVLELTHNFVVVLTVDPYPNVEVSELGRG